MLRRSYLVVFGFCRNTELPKLFIQFFHESGNSRTVLRDTLPEGAEETFINVNDGTCEGITYHDMPAFTVQFHPEACAGPKDTEELFGRFIQMMRDYKEKEGASCR